MTTTTLTKIVPMGKRPKRQWLKKFRLRYLLALGFLIWGVYEYAFVQAPILHHEYASEVALTQKLKAAAQTRQQLQSQIKALHSNSYIASVAEKRYNLVLPGDILFATSRSVH